VERLTTANDYYQLTLSLVENRKQRQRQKRFIVQGVKAITAALAHEWTFESLWVREKARLSPWALDVMRRARPRRAIQTSEDLFGALSGKSEPGELVAVLELPANRLEQITIGRSGLVVVCDRPGSPGNLGSIVRSAEAFGASGVIVTGHAADIYDPQTIRGSVGTLLSLPVTHVSAPRAAVDWMRSRCPSIQLVGTSARAETLLEDSDFRPPVAIVLGSENDGLSRWWTEACDETVRIPLSGAASSLNVAAAATVFLNEIRRQRDPDW